MKLNIKAVCFLLAQFIVVSSACFADGGLFILQNLSLPSHMQVYEDVNEFEVDVEAGPIRIINRITLKNNYDVPIRVNPGKSFLNSISNGAVYLHAPGLGLIKQFLEHYVYLCKSRWGDDGAGAPVWVENHKAFPLKITEDDTKNPGTVEFHISLRGSDKGPGKWQYIPPFAVFEPNAASCRVNKNWCTYSSTKCKRPEEDPVTGDPIPGTEHHCNELNVYGGDGKPTLYTLIDNMAQDSSGFERPDSESGIKFRLEVLDRTPPTFDNVTGDNFPDLATTTPATTGDFYAVEGLVIHDNSGGNIGVCMVIGEILGAPDLLTWQTSESWEKLLPRTIESGDESGFIVIPNLCHGVMRYSIFAWDQHGLLNPGEPRITNDIPEQSYSLRSPPGPVDLIKDHENALPWHLAYPDPENLMAIRDSLDASSRRGEGLLHVRDNDLPNILIRIDSVKRGTKQVFFPPVTTTLQIMPSMGSGATNQNQADYNSFIEEATDQFTTAALASETVEPYFKILDVRRSTVMSDTEANELHRFKTDEEFIRNQFRLEDYLTSDTREADGQPVELDLATFGARNSFGEEITAVLTMPLQEDVEHFIHVWADDNVKWVTIDPYDNPTLTAQSIPSGIVAGEVIVRVPNQLPEFFHRVPIDQSSSLPPPIRTVFREPTPPLQPPGNLSPSFAPDDINYYTINRFPYIEVSVQDYAGFKRKIKLFLQISDENPDVRVIERRNEMR